MVKTLLTLCMSLVFFGAQAQAAEWVESGTVCAVGSTKTESLINLSARLRQPIITLEGDFNTFSGAEDLGLYLKAPYQTRGAVVYEERTSLARYNQVACQMIIGKKPELKNSSSKLGRLVCKRKDGVRDVILSENAQGIRYEDSWGKVRNCSMVPGGKSDLVFSCVDRKLSDPQPIFLNLDRDAKELSVSVYSPVSNIYTESLEAQCALSK